MKPSDTLKTINVLVLALLAAFLFFEKAWLVWIAAMLAAGNAFESRWTDVIARGWMRFATTLGHLNTRILLSLIFFLVLTPIALLYRLLNREKVDHFLANRRGSTFEDVHKAFGREDFEKLW